MEIDKKKIIVGLFGEMQLAMELYLRGWQIHKAYIDDGIDFIISKYYCKKCKKNTSQFIREGLHNNKTHKCVTNLCIFCQTDNLIINSKYLQIKTSEGIPSKTLGKDVRDFSFHPKIRNIIDNEVYNIWLAIFMSNNKKINNNIIHFYIFNTKDVKKFDNIKLPSYQITDNQKTTLKINRNGDILTIGNIYNYDCFKYFHNNFSALDK